MPEDEFRLRAAIYWIGQEFGNYLREDRAKEDDSDSKAALERKWMLIYATRKVFQFYFGDNWKQELQKLYKGDWTIGNGPKGEIMLRIYRDAKAGLIQTYKIAKKFDPSFVHRNWMRNKNTPSSISEHLTTTVLVNRDPIKSVPG